MNMKEFFVQPRSPELELHHQVHFSVDPGTPLHGVLPQYSGGGI